MSVNCNFCVFSGILVEFCLGFMDFGRVFGVN